jgi:hypothetical protein
MSNLWKALSRPDFVILRGDEYSRLVGVSRDATGPKPPWAAVVESIFITGTIERGAADLAVETGVSVAGEGATWVAIRLDGQTLTSATEEGEPLPVRALEGGFWQVEVTGPGRHRVLVKLIVPVSQTTQGRRLELAIPEAASTRLLLDLPRKLSSAETGASEPVAFRWDEAAKTTRIGATLTPRARLLLAWRSNDESAEQLPPLLASTGEIALDIDMGMMRARSSWTVRAIRGETRSLELTLDPEDEVLELELDNQPVAARYERSPGVTRMTIPLPEPLITGGERCLVVTSRRPIGSGSPARLPFHGFPFTDARQQAGAIGIAQGANLFVTGVANRGVRQIDPRAELPADLRARPATALAYRFSEQPFDLTLGVEATRPQLRSDARTTVALEPQMARLDSWLEFQNGHGRLFELTLGVPPGLAIDSVGPDELIGSWQIGGVPETILPGVSVAGYRLLTVRLAPKLPEMSKVSIHVAGRQSIDTSRGVNVALIQPIGAISGGGRIAVSPASGLTVELAEGLAKPEVVRTGFQNPPTDWPWPGSRPPATTPVLWLRYDETPVALPLRVTNQPRVLTHATALVVQVGREEVDVRQETECSVLFGSADHVDVQIPELLEGRWEVDGATVGQYVDLGRAATGGRNVRLELSAPIVRSSPLRFRYRIPTGPALAAGRTVNLSIPWIRFLDGSNRSVRLQATVSSATGLIVAQTGKAWPTFEESGGEEEGVLLRIAESEADATSLDLRISARKFASLPKVVAPRLALRTIVGTDGDLRTSAWYWVESHESGLSFSLPPGAELVRARVAGEVVAQVEQVPLGFRIAFPSAVGTSGTIVQLEYILRGSRSTAAWVPPRLLEGGLVQQTVWEVSLPWGRELVGVPDHWADENEWAWTGFGWSRRPRRTPAQLGSWALGASARSAPLLHVLDADTVSDSQTHAFGRAGDPAELALTVVSRAALVTVCSGTVLLFGGLLLLIWRPKMSLVWVLAAGLVLAAAALVRPSATILALQAGSIGVALTGLLAVMQRLLERSRPRSTTLPYSDPSGRGEGSSSGSSLSRGAVAGSDESTAIRARPISTMDHVAANPQGGSSQVSSPPATESPAGRSSRVERVRRGGRP